MEVNSIGRMTFVLKQVFKLYFYLREFIFMLQSVVGWTHEATILKYIKIKYLN